MPLEKVNVNGGAIAHGPPARRHRRDDPGHRSWTSWSAATCGAGLATLCVGGGMGIATIVERV